VSNEKRVSADEFLFMSASVGDALQLQDYSPARNRYYTKLIGYVNKLSIVVTHPQAGEKLLGAGVGDAFLVRGFSGRTTYEFDTRILNIYTHPYPHLHLSFPEQVSTLELRGAMRIKVNLPCSVVASVDGLKMPATIADLSTSGTSIQSAAKLGKAGDTVQINFKLSVQGEESALVMPAVIRNAGDAGAGAAVTYGLEFVGVSTKARIALQSYVCIMLIGTNASE
jgi:c-di-GMP-binding flagellar brake protein YcgR